MGDHTVEGIIGIVIIVVIAAAFFQQSYSQPYQAMQDDQSLAGQASSSGVPAEEANACEADVYCVGSALYSVAADCTLEINSCKNGCSQGACN